MATRPPPNNRTVANDGFGLTQAEFVGPPGREDNMTNQGKRVYFIRSTFQPTYQMGIARDSATDGIYSSARVWMHLDDAGSEGFYRFPVTQGGDLHDQGPPVFEVSFVVANTQALSAFTVVEHTSLVHVGIWARALTPSTDFLGIDVSAFPAGVPYVSTATITQASLFPDGIPAPAGTAESLWGTFVGRELSDGTGNIRVLAQLLFRPSVFPAASRQSDLTSLVTFVIDPVGKTVVEPVSTVVTDVAFSPHQLTEGANVPVMGETPRTFLWCAGRYDPNFLYTFVNDGQDITDRGTHNASSVGLWVCENPETMTPWHRISHTAQAESTFQTTYVNNTISPDNVALYPRDIGVSFDPAWQRLTAVAVDTDASQDPHYRRQPIP